ncbi:hypothetical protein RJ639_013990 [Escallonia herrerae]|uniref:Pectinesterase inhibitor domain-containing protein n=1 Tax=Escallonia herrerae TaxID=1293975 RepID=A0AA88VJA8_9ASTE|nr:hypothetical protein RJ639_013990 [Escallonia herrerae]
MEHHSYQAFFLICFFPLVLLNSANAGFESPSPAPDLQPVSSPGLEPELSPTPSSDPPANHVSFPPSESFAPSNYNPPSESPAPSISDLPPESPVPPSDVNPTIRQICDKTDHPALCLSTIAPYLKGKADMMSVLDVAIKASAEVTKLALFMAKKVASLPGTPPDVASILKDCKGSYDDALYNFQNAMDALPARDTGTMSTMLSAVITDVGDCDDEFSGQNNPLANYADRQWLLSRVPSRKSSCYSGSFRNSILIHRSFMRFFNNPVTYVRISWTVRISFCTSRLRTHWGRDFLNVSVASLFFKNL